MENVDHTSELHNSDGAPHLLSSQAGVEWIRITGTRDIRRTATENVFSQRAGPTPLAYQAIEVESPITAFQLFVDEPMLQSIWCHTIQEGTEKMPDYSLSIENIEEFIGLQLARGVLVTKNTSIKDLWSIDWGPPVFKSTMPRNQFQTIMKYIRFDNKNSRQNRRTTDKFCLFSETWNKFTVSDTMYVPGPYLTIDEQLFPCKTRCPFIQYMSSKPDKFGIKFWVLTDTESKYVSSASPYLGKEETRQADQDMPGDIVLKLCDSYLNQRRGITTDNFFTSLRLANTLIAKKTTLLSTIRKQRREVPDGDVVLKEQSLYSSEIYKCQSGCTLTMYKAKRTRMSIF